MGQSNELRSGLGVCGTLAERRERFRQVKELVTGQRRDVDTPLHLSPLARGVLGLLQVGILDASSMAFYLHEDRLKVIKVKTAVERSKNPIVIRARREGLPACASVKLLWGSRLKCGHYKMPLASVPCPKCAPLWLDHYPAVRVYQAAKRDEPVQPELTPVPVKTPATIPKRFDHLYDEPTAKEGAIFEPTQAMPGSSAKTEVLAYRVANGLPLFHPDDRRYVSLNLS